jgi:hypothetical protein
VIVPGLAFAAAIIAAMVLIGELVATTRTPPVRAKMVIGARSLPVSTCRSEVVKGSWVIALSAAYISV